MKYKKSAQCFRNSLINFSKSTSLCKKAALEAFFALHMTSMSGNQWMVQTVE